MHARESFLYEIQFKIWLECEPKLISFDIVQPNKPIS